MGSFFVQDDLQPEPLSDNPSGCQFESESGIKCGITKILARGYCSKHYRQLSRSGVFAALNLPADRSEALPRNAERLIKARDILDHAAPLFARRLIKASKVAADKGDHRPALAGLLHTKTIDPIAQTYDSSRLAKQEAQGVVIKIGVALSGQTSSPKTLAIEDPAIIDSAIVEDTKSDDLLPAIDVLQDE